MTNTCTKIGRKSKPNKMKITLSPNFRKNAPVVSLLGKCYIFNSDYLHMVDPLQFMRSELDNNELVPSWEVAWKSFANTLKHKYTNKIRMRRDDIESHDNKWTPAFEIMKSAIARNAAQKKIAHKRKTPYPGLSDDDRKFEIIDSCMSIYGGLVHRSSNDKDEDKERANYLIGRNAKITIQTEIDNRESKKNWEMYNNGTMSEERGIEFFIMCFGVREGINKFEDLNEIACMEKKMCGLANMNAVNMNILVTAALLQ